MVLGTALAGAGGGTTTTTSGGLMPFGEKVAVLDVTGVLGEGPGYQADTAALIAQVKQWQDNNSIRALVVRVNSPGGAVSATQELYQALREYSKETGNPVVTSMGDIAASGGFYTAIATDKIYANPGTLTGSIGVIFNFYDFQGIQEKVGLRSRSIKSGEFKDLGSGSRAMTSEERALLQDTILDTYEQFLEAVIENRSATIEARLKEQAGGAPVSKEQIESHARDICDGRIFSGRQAHELGMVDELGTLKDAIDFAARQAGIKGEPRTVRGPIRRPTLFGAIESKLGMVERAVGGAGIEYRATF